MKTTILCPECGQEHQMFWQVHKNEKRDLVYRCNKVLFINSEKDMAKYKSAVQLVPENLIPDPAVLAILPVKWSRGYAKTQQGKKQLQLILMNK